jgi:hypothetical protein
MKLGGAVLMGRVMLLALAKIIISGATVIYIF